MKDTNCNSAKLDNTDWINDKNNSVVSTMNSTNFDHDNVDTFEFAKNPKKHCQELFNEEWSIERISTQYNLSTRQIIGYLGKTCIADRINTLYQSGMQYRDIADKIGMHLRTVYRYLEMTRLTEPLTAVEVQKTLEYLGNDYSLVKIATELNKTTKNVQQALLRECMYEYLQFVSLVDLQTKYKISKAEISKFLTKRGILIHDSGDKTKIVKHIDNWQFWKPIDPFLEELFIGELLGDGNVRVNIHSSTPEKKTNLPPHSLSDYQQSMQNIEELIASDLRKLSETELTRLIEKFNKSTTIVAETPTALFRLHKSILEKFWVEQIHLLLGTHNYSNQFFEYLSPNENEKLIWKVRCESKSSVQLYSIYKRFYPRGVKIVPKKLKITPGILLFWFIGDGSFVKRQLFLATNSFTKRDVEYLANLLSRTINIETKVYLQPELRYPDSKYYKISISGRNNIDRFITYLKKSNEHFCEIAMREFPWKFDPRITKPRTLQQRKNLDHIKKYLNN